MAIPNETAFAENTTGSTPAEGKNNDLEDDGDKNYLHWDLKK